MTDDRPMLGHADLEILLHGLPSRIRGQDYLDFLDRLERAGLRFQRRSITLSKSAPPPAHGKPPERKP